MSSLPPHQNLLVHVLGTLQLGNGQLGWTGSGLAAGILAGVDHSGNSISSFGKGWLLAVPGFALMALALGSWALGRNWHITSDLLRTEITKTKAKLTCVRIIPCGNTFLLQANFGTDLLEELQANVLFWSTEKKAFYS